MRAAPALVIGIALAGCGDLDRPEAGRLIRSTEEMFSDREPLRFDIGLEPAAMDALAVAPRQWVVGSFRYGPYTIDRVGVRLKGNATLRTLDEKPSFKIAFDAYDGDQRFFGLEALTLNNMEQDPTMLRERLAYGVFRAAGVPAPRTGYARVYLNGELLGLYANIETVDDVFLARAFADPSGGLYEGDYGDDLHPTHVWRFEQDEGDDAQRSDLLALTQWVHRDGDVPFYDPATLLDTDEFLSFAATEAVVGHWDGYWIAHNYRVYHEPTLDRWSFLPWGVDQTFRQRIEPFDQISYLTGRCRDSARCLVDYVARAREVVELMETLDLEAEVDAVAAVIDDAAREDPRKSFSNGVMDRRRETLLAFVKERPAEMRAWLDCTAAGAEVDADGDGFGGCFRDCDDARADVNPDAAEICDDIDNDCSDNVDDNIACGCPETSIGGDRYLLCDLDMSWEQARGWCGELGAALVRIDDAQRNAALHAAAQQVRQDSWYIGLSDVGRAWGDFAWLDGTRPLFEAWADGEPNLDGAEHCAVFEPTEPTWNDIACGNRRPFICAAP
jgi:hypothetical protein